MPNQFGKTRDIENPYAVYRSPYGWEWRILKTYKMPKSEAKDPYARWFVAATSPLMDNGNFDELKPRSFEYGDEYKTTITRNAALISGDPEWLEEYAPKV